jgi:hypothetical protein
MASPAPLIVLPRSVLRVLRTCSVPAVVAWVSEESPKAVLMPPARPPPAANSSAPAKATVRHRLRDRLYKISQGVPPRPRPARRDVAGRVGDGCLPENKGGPTKTAWSSCRARERRPLYDGRLAPRSPRNGCHSPERVGSGSTSVNVRKSYRGSGLVPT